MIINITLPYTYLLSSQILVFAFTLFFKFPSEQIHFWQLVSQFHLCDTAQDLKVIKKNRR